MKVFTAFSGYDSQCMALDRLHSNFNKFNYELVGWSEIDKYAIQAHNVIYPQYKDRNYGDISKINWDKVDDFDLLTYSSPCTDFSAAGLQKGGEKGSGTRSSLLWECERAIKSKRPKYLLMENVAALVSSKFIKLFNKWQHTLESYGYINYAKVLNAKEYGVPQNRERIFMVSVRDDLNQKFYFPQPFKFEKRLKDILEDKVDEKYYLSEKCVKGFEEHNKNHIAKNTGFLFKPKTGEDIGCCVRSNSALAPTDNTIIEPRVVQIGNIVNREGFKNPQEGRIYGTDGLSPTIQTSHGGGFEPKIVQRQRGYNKGGERDLCPTIGCNSFQENNKLLIPQATEKGYIEVEQGGVFDGSYPNPKTRRGRVQENGNVTPALMASGEPLNRYEGDFRIRKLTPTECFRLMDVSENDIVKLLNSGISNSQLYKLAGNSIVVSCLYHIFRKLFVEKQNEGIQTELF